jgi:thiamine biosynthesis lipoprotein
MQTLAPIPYRRYFEAIGTQWEIETTAPLAVSVQQRMADRIESFDKTYSRFRPDSLVTQVAQAPTGGRFEFPEDSRALFQLYDQLYALTDGAVDPLVGRRLEQLGYDSRYSLIPTPGSEVPAPPTVRWPQDVRRNDTTISTRRPLVIDVGAAGKGHLVDTIAQILLAAQVRDFTIDAGGDIRHYGAETVRVGLEHPLHPDQVIGVVELANGALCASATTRRAWGNGLHHVLDARRGLPTRQVLATWVLAADALTADGLATALFFSSAEALQAQFAFSAVRLFPDLTVEVSENFPGELFF